MKQEIETGKEAEASDDNQRPKGDGYLERHVRDLPPVAVNLAALIESLTDDAQRELDMALKYKRKEVKLFAQGELFALRKLAKLLNISNK